MSTLKHFLLTALLAIATRPVLGAAPVIPTPTAEQLALNAKAESLQASALRLAQAQQSMQWVEGATGWTLTWKGPDQSSRGPIALPPRNRQRILRAGDVLSFDRSYPFYRSKTRIQKALATNATVGLLERNGYQVCFSPDLEYLGILRTTSAYLLPGWDGTGDLPDHMDAEPQPQHMEVYGASGKRSGFDLVAGSEDEQRAMPNLSLSGRYIAFYQGDAISLYADNGSLVKRFDSSDGTGMRFASGGDYLILVRDGVLFSVFDVAGKTFLKQAVSLPGDIEQTSVVPEVAGDKTFTLTDRDSGVEKVIK